VRLDSLPLAVELAAARTKALSPGQILARLSQRLDLLKGGRDADPRQQTLRATIEWSYDLLSDDERQLFRRLSVFAGSCSLEAAEAVTRADVDALQSLVEKSLLRFSNERFWMLETIREFAREQLGPTEVEPLERRHREHMVAFAEANGPGLRSASEAAVADAVAHEHPNLREAVAHALAAGEPDDVARIVGTLFPYLILHGHMGEALEWMAGPLADRDLLSNDGLAGLLIGGSEIARFAGDLDLAIELKEQYVSLPDDSQPRRWAAGLLADLAEIALDQGDIARARSYAERSAEAGAGPRAELPFAELALRLGDLSSAESHALAALAGMNEGEFNHACALELLGETARRSGDPAHAREHFADGLREFAQLRDGGGVADCLDGFSRLAAEAGDHDRAGRLSRAARTLRAESGRTPIRSDVPPVEASEALRAESAAMTLDEAVDLALSND
jgi:tetratricopeptide (TPR) repeat protein